MREALQGAEMALDERRAKADMDIRTDRRAEIGRSSRIWRMAGIICLLLLTLFLPGCAQQSSRIQDLHGSISGNEYYIDTFSNTGELTMRTHGKNIDIESNVVKKQSYTQDGGWIHTKELSDVITITIDGHEIISCGDTCIFYDTGLQPEYTFYDEIDSSGGEGIGNMTSVAGTLNRVKNAFGKPVIAVIKSQTGVPLYAFSGEQVYWEIPDDLPDMTKLSIDGRPLYIHRANFQLIDRELLE